MIEQDQIVEKESSSELPELKFYPSVDMYNRFGGIDPRFLYLRYFLKLPNIFEVFDIDKNAFNEFFREKYASKILKEIFSKSIKRGDKDKYEDQVFILAGEILINIEGNDISVLCENTETQYLQEIILDIKKFRNKKKKRSEICMIVSGQTGLETRKIKFRKPKIILEENYNDGFGKFHNKIKELLKKKNESGLYLFHGKPGTGKSTYIRYLIKNVKKKAIFLSPKMAGSLDQVAMIKLLLDNKNCILIIEDAEELVVSRKSGRNSNLSMILNLTDGILGESLGIKIIATFNTELKNIDPALMRKGRLKASYEFAELSVGKTNALLRKQGIETMVSQPKVLAEIFNYSEENNFNQTIRKAVGFRN